MVVEVLAGHKKVRSSGGINFLITTNKQGALPGCERSIYAFRQRKDRLGVFGGDVSGDDDVNQVASSVRGRTLRQDSCSVAIS
jgi:hypothetical protein